MTEELRLKILEEADRQEAEYNKYHNWEQGTKILINSFYGGLANSYMYFFNVDLAECITKQGKSAILYAEKNINKYFNEYWHKDKKTHEAMGITVTGKVVNDVTVYIDTDSCDKDTVIHCEDKDRTIEELYNYCEQYGNGGNTLAGHESNLCNVRVLNYSESDGLYYANVKRVIRHIVSKEKWLLKTKMGKHIVVTNDHSLVVYRKGNQTICKPHEILKNDTVLVSFLCTPCNLMLCFDYQFDQIEKIECIGNFENEYVYDIEMDDCTHTFIGNDILVHNSVYSQFDEVISTTDWGMGKDDPNWRVKYKKQGDSEYRYRSFCGKKSKEYVIEYLNLESDDIIEYEVESVEGTPKDFTLLLDEVFLGKYFNFIFEKYAEKLNAKNYLNFELESYADSGIWLAKKKYMQNIRWLDKIPRHECYENLTKIKSKGVELIQASSPSFVRKSLNHLVKWIFGHDNFQMREFMEEVKKIKRDYMVANIEEICWNKKPSNYWQYVISDNGELELSSGTPITVKGLALYNFLLNENPKYKSKYGRLKDGMMCKYYYCKYEGCEMFAFEPGMYPVEFAPEANRELMFEKTIIDPLNRIMEVLPHATKLEPDLMLISKLF